MMVVWITPNSGYAISYIDHQVKPDINTENKREDSSDGKHLSIYLSIYLSINQSIYSELI